MGISARMNSSRKSIWPSTSLKAFPKGMPRPFSFLITHQAIKNELRTRCHPGKCRKVPPFHLSLDLISLPSIQGRRRAGHTTRAGHACDTASFRMATRSYFTSQMIILPCRAGSRGWNKSSRSAAYGRLRGSSRSVQIFAAPLDALTAAVGGFFFYSPTLPVTSLNFKNSSSPEATSATSTRSIIVNSISSSNTGARPNFDSVPWSARRPLIRWKSSS
jgi:hypothetical protein